MPPQNVNFTQWHIVRSAKGYMLNCALIFKWAFKIANCLSPVCLSVGVSVLLSVNFSHFYLLLKNPYTTFSLTLHKASLGEGDSFLFKWSATPFFKGKYLRNSENTLTKFKIFSSRTNGPISTKFNTKHLLVKGI